MSVKPGRKLIIKHLKKQKPPLPQGETAAFVGICICSEIQNTQI